MENELRRIATYSELLTPWGVSPIRLAQQGLYYKGVDDTLECFACRASFTGWVGNYDVQKNHERVSPQCALLNTAGASAARGVERKKQETVPRVYHDERVCVNDPPKFPDHATLSQRLGSFKRGNVSRGHMAEGLADAGWFWIGPGDKVQCFQCGGNLRDWEPEDDPWEEHKRWYSHCPYIKAYFPTARKHHVDPVQRTAHLGSFPVDPREIKARMDTNMVRRALDLGFSKDLIQMAIEKNLSTTGDDFPNIFALMEMYRQLEEEKQRTPTSINV